MEYRNLGNTGLRVSALSFGSWVTFAQQISEETAAALMKTAYDSGVNFFDNAEGYAAGKAEEVMGRILKKMGWDRETWLISSKVYLGTLQGQPNTRGLSRKHVFEACHRALKRFQVDYLDLYLCHRADPTTPIVETVAAMTDLIRQGKVMYWGTSEWTARDIALAHAAAREHNLYAPVLEQPQYNLFQRTKVEKDYLPLFKHPGLGTTIWSPLAFGLLTGKYLDGDPGNTRTSLKGYEGLMDRYKLDDTSEHSPISIVRKLAKLAEEVGISLPRLGVAWCLKNPHVSTVILGASKVSQLEENLKAVEDYHKLDDALMERIDSITGTRPEPEQIW